MKLILSTGSVTSKAPLLTAIVVSRADRLPFSRSVMEIVSESFASVRCPLIRKCWLPVCVHCTVSRAVRHSAATAARSENLVCFIVIEDLKCLK